MVNHSRLTCDLLFIIRGCCSDKTSIIVACLEHAALLSVGQVL